MPSSFLDCLDGFLMLLSDFFSFGGLASKKEEFQKIPLDEMIRQSKIIAIGKVLRIKEPIFRERAVATIEIEQIIVGNYEGKHIDVTYYPRLTFEARLLLNQRCIFFIGKNNRIVEGCAGKIPIEEEKVEVCYILGEATSQTLKDFIKRIKSSKSRQEMIFAKPSSE